MSGMRILLLAAVAALTLSACDNGPSAVAHKPSSGAPMATNTGEESFATGPTSDPSLEVDRRHDPVKLVDGKPMWSASRKYSADENARRAFDRNGRDFGARDIDTFVRKAHDFVGSPPKGTLTMTRRNGDTLFYDPKDNVFAVASKEGAPRTMFHPDEGRAYWDEQKAREEKRQSASSRRRDDDA
jgi:pyocin large subunit-like protein